MNAAGLLTAEEAVIHTAQVEVKTLTIRGKQVTLSVFRQVPERDLLDRESGEISGTPWGCVNYYWGDMRKVLHVVWQDGSVLYRALVTPGRPAAGTESYRIEQMLGAVNALVDEYWRARVVAWGDPPEVVEGTLTFTHGGWTFRRPLVDLPLVQTWIERHENVLTYLTPRMLRKYDGVRYGDDRMETDAEALARCDKEIAEIRKVHYQTPRAIPVVLAALIEQAEAWKQARAEKTARDLVYTRNYATLEELDQLFIAV